jgi:hypothetical protein
VSKTERVYSVCEVLADLANFHGKIISVRGIVSGGGHGAFLVDTCPLQIVVKGFTWLNAIALSTPFPPGRPFYADRSAFDRADAAAKRLKRREGDQIVMTYLGMLETADLATRTFVNRNGKPAGLGFGAQNVAPAQLLIKTAMDVDLVGKPGAPRESSGPMPRSEK